MCFKYQKVLKVDEFCTLFWPLTFLSGDKTLTLAHSFPMKEAKVTIGNFRLFTLGHPFQSLNSANSYFFFLLRQIWGLN